MDKGTYAVGQRVVVEGRDGCSSVYKAGVVVDVIGECVKVRFGRWDSAWTPVEWVRASAALAAALDVGKGK